MRYGLFDVDGTPLAFYSNDIHSQIPDGCIEISEEVWMDLIAGAGRKRLVDGKVVTDAPERPKKEKSSRIERNSLLSTSDWVVIRNLELGKPIPPEWVRYRESLRNFPENPENWLETPTAHGDLDE